MDTLLLQQEVNQHIQDALVKGHTVLVKKIAHHLSSRLPQSIQFDDLIQAGMIGLLEAARHYDASKGASFETYAGIRIRGHILDEVRRNDWVPRSVYRNSRMISEAVKHVENRLGREALAHEIAEELGVSLDEYHDMLQDAISSHLYGFDDIGVTDDLLYTEETVAFNEPHTQVFHDDLKERLTAVIDGLPRNERLALSLYYEQDLNLKEIGEVLGVSESRISQVLSQATHRIKSRLTE